MAHMNNFPNVNLNNIISKRKIERKKLTVPIPLKRRTKKREFENKREKRTFGLGIVAQCPRLYFRTYLPCSQGHPKFRRNSM